jgi:hypothetical protein
VLGANLLLLTGQQVLDADYVFITVMRNQISRFVECEGPLDLPVIFNAADHWQHQNVPTKRSAAGT